jgi:nitric oxide reductase subunit B
MQQEQSINTPLSPWWRHATILTVIVGFTVLIWISVKSYDSAPPIPEKVINQAGETILTKGDILAGQGVFLKHGLMENGTIWGHGAYLGPDFSAEYLHTLAQDTRDILAMERYKRDFARLTLPEREAVQSEVSQLLKQNRYDSQSATLVFSSAEVFSFEKQVSPKPWPAGPLYRGSGGDQPAHRVFCMDRLGLRRQPPRKAILLYQ